MKQISWQRIFLVLSLCGISQAQTTTGSVEGRITDPSGAAVTKAAVMLTNTATNQTMDTTSEEAGDYTFPLVAPGNYRLTVTVNGFRKFDREFTLGVAQRARVDVGLIVGNPSETVEVSEKAVLLEADSSSLGQVINNRQVVDLPLNGRNPFALAALTPGFVGLGGFGIGLTRGRGAVVAAGANNFQANGGITASNEILLDGVPITVCCQGQPALIPSIDIVQEFRTQTNNSEAEFGRTSGGILNIITKAGGNALHGTAYEFVRNEKFDANGFFSNRAGIAPLPGRSDLRPPLRYNQFGFSITGPVVIPKLYNGKNKTFFSGGFERVFLRRSLFGSFSVPTTAMRTGDLSASPVPVYNPASTTADPANPGQYIRTAFFNNQIPANRINPVALNILKLYPTPTSAGITNNFSSVASQRDDSRQGNVRLDHYFSERYRTFARYSLEDNDHSEPNYWNSVATPGDFTQFITAKTFVWDNLYTFSPDLIAEFRYGFSWQTNYRQPYSTGTDLVALGFSPAYVSQLQAEYLPPISISGFDGPSENANQAWSHYSHVAAFSLTFVRGKHTVKTGWDGRLLLDQNHSVTVPSGEFSFGTTFTNGPNPFNAVGSGGVPYLSFAGFLLGNPDGGDMFYTDATSLRNWYHAFYFQDDWKVTQRLTLNLGLRWDIETGITERYNRIAWLDPDAVNPLSQTTGLNLKGVVQFACRNGNPCQRWETAWANPGPRVGFAYQATNNTVLRGGYGIYYLPTTQRSYVASNPGFLVENDVVPSLDGVTPITTLNNPFPLGLAGLAGASQGALTGVGNGVSGNIYNTPMSYVQQWNFGIQQQLGWNMIADIAYAGSHGLRLPIILNLDTLNPAYYGAYGDKTRVSQLNSQVNNPFYGQITTGALSTPKIQLAQLLKPFPQYTSFNGDALPWGQNIYHSLQTRVRKPFGSGLTLTAAYTWSKNIGNVNNLTTGFLDTGTPGYQNAYKL
ncbi:MAG: TonB-dependent receptor, partial [Acidobacteriaceae bacterium]|nr:TonB-dependent receptor [Acidobacteriaceae bacterium]